MTSSAAPRSAVARASRAMTWAAVTLSSAAVGSSATTIAGSPMSAIAMFTRCRWPPDKSPG